uniref:C-type lectin domain-containing protein n=1 Tax=Romanomermis culicivorax TaxID=13658 RepID=A0A915IR52_ROMCU
MKPLKGEKSVNGEVWNGRWGPPASKLKTSLAGGGMNGFNCSIETVWCQSGSSIEDVNCDYDRMNIRMCQEIGSDDTLIITIIV